MTKLDPVKITSDLIKCKSIAPEDGGAIQLIKELLLNEGFKCQSIPRNEIQNLFARWGDAKDGLTFCFNGHIDVVPPGPIETWSNDPFHALERDGFLFGRGAADMKSAVAAFIAASVEYINENEAKGSIVIAITGDEEGEAPVRADLLGQEDTPKQGRHEEDEMDPDIPNRALLAEEPN